MPMEIRPAVSRQEYERMTTDELRAAFLVERLFTPGELNLVYWETDRTVLGSATPLDAPLGLEADRELAAEFFCERRELGVINIGGAGTVTVDGARYALGALGCLYVGRGSRDVIFASDDLTQPARFYLVSYPAHAKHPTKPAPLADANQIQLGAPETANQRTIFQYIHEAGIRSCQLVLGFTQLASGSVWNTMPPHTHARRSEVYLYFDLPTDAAAFHFMGPGNETRHVVVRNGQAVLSPIWSIHAGCGTRNYSFIWAMGGENQRFADMDGIAVTDLR
jgi:4-deoxy-L-threo-5-hexosulose-uronate ketol-isomerase